MKNVTILLGDARKTLQKISDKSVQCCVTSPPYFRLRDYGYKDQIGWESSVEEYVQRIVLVFAEIWRVLRTDGVLWLNIGDSYAANRNRQVPSTMGGRKHGPAQGVSGRGSKVPEGLKPKDLLGIPWELAFALRRSGWYLRQDIIWHKPNVMPESVQDRCVRSHEYVFLFSKSRRYYFDFKAIQEPTVDGSSVRRKRSVWSINTVPSQESHAAMFPPELVRNCIVSSSKPGQTIIDPFAGSGTVAGVALALKRKAVVCEISKDYANEIPQRVKKLEKQYGELK